MKKLLLSVLFLMFAVSYGWSLSIIPKIGFDIPGTVIGNKDFGLDNNFKSYGTYAGWNIGAEVRGDISKYFMWGAGFQYDIPRHMTDTGLSWNDSNISFSPIYATIICAPFGQWGSIKIKPYLKAFLGYNVLNSVGSGVAGSVSGGINYGAGLGFEYLSFVFEMLASSSHGTLKDVNAADTVNDVEYKKITLSLGYKFNV